MDRLNDNFENTPNIEEAANMLGMSESKFQRLFKSLIGNTYYNYVFQQKMNAGM